MENNENSSSPENKVPDQKETPSSALSSSGASKPGIRDSGQDETAAKGKKRSPVWIFTWIVIAFAVVAVPTVYFVYGPKKKKEKPVELVEAAPKDSPARAYEKLSSKIDDMLSAPEGDDKTLLALARDRFALAVEMQDLEKICKSADFTAAIADRMKDSSEALKFYDIHNLFSPEQKILEAKFLLCQRYKIRPGKSGAENDLYDMHSKITTAGDELATDLSPPLESIDDYMKVMHYYDEQRSKLLGMKAGKSAYAYLLKTWIWEKKELNLLCRISARQKYQQDFVDLSLLQSNDPAAELAKLKTAGDFEQCRVFQKLNLSAVDAPPGFKVYLDPENKMLVVLIMDTKDEIAGFTFISLSAAAGAKCDDAIIELLAPAVYGKLADEFPEAVEILKNRMTLANFRGVGTCGGSQVYTLVDKDGNLLGFELNQSHSGEKIEAAKAELYALIPKDRLGNRKLQQAIRMKDPSQEPGKQEAMLKN